MRASAGGNDRIAAEAATVDQVAPRVRQSLQARRPDVAIVRLERTSGGVLKQRGPHPFGLADHDRVGVIFGFLGQKRGMRAAENDHLAPIAE